MDLRPLMTPERILGALIWNVMHGELSNELIFMLDTLPQDFIRGLEGDLSTLVSATQGGNLDPAVRDSLIDLLADEIRGTLRLLAEERGDLPEDE